MMTEELSSLITDVRATAMGFEEDSSNTLDLLKNMADGSETQMVQLRNATEAVDETDLMVIGCDGEACEPRPRARVRCE